MKKLFTLKSSSTTNRILITLLLCVTVGTQSIWGQNRFLPRSKTVNDPKNATSEQITFENFQINGTDVSSLGRFFHCVGLGNIETTSDPTVDKPWWTNTVTVTVNFRQKEANKPKGGAVVIWFDYNWGLDRDFCVINVPYTCEEGKDLVWDLRTVKGPSNNNDNDTYPWYQNMKSSNDARLNYQRAINSEWVTKFGVRQVDRTPHVFNDPAFAAKEAVDGNNAYYIPETAGLVFDTQGRRESFAVSYGVPQEQYEAFYNSTSPVDYVNSYTYSNPTFGNDNQPNISNPSTGKLKLTIPNLTKGWFVKLYWARHAKNAGHEFKTTNVTDLNGQYINSSFSITGSWVHNNEYVGPTTFIVNDNGDVSFELQNDNGWTNLYKIVVSEKYSTDMKIVEVGSLSDDGYNSPSSDTYDWALNTETDHVTLIGDETKTKIYSGWTGHVLCQNAVSPEIRIEKEGSVTIEKVNNKDVETVVWTRPGVDATYNMHKLHVTGGYGNIKIIQEMKLNGYVLDKKEQWIAVGHVDPQAYPYTWEFTSYNMNDSYCGWGNLYQFLTWTGTQASGAITNNLQYYGQYRLWEAEQGAPTSEAGTYTMFTASSVPGSLKKEMLDKPLFAQGSQLAYRNNGEETVNVMNEYKGLGVTVEEIADDKYGFIMGKGHGWLWGVTELLIPDVDPGMAVYIQTETASTKPYFEIEGGGTITTDDAALGEGATLIEKKWVVDGTEVVDGEVKESGHHEDDNISTYVLGAIITPTSGNKAHVRVKGLDPTKRIFRIGVTNIRKEINKYGYATESRNRPIDHMMTGFLTKADAHAYFAKEFTEYSDVTSGQEPIGKVNLVPAVWKEDVSIDRGGNSVPQTYENIPAGTGVVLYADNVSAKIEVPLFVPAIHVGSTSTSDNLLVANVTSNNIGGTAKKDYILTNIYQHRQNLNVDLGGTEGDIGFYRAQSGTLGANKSYLNLDNVTSSSAKLVLFSFFDDEEEDIHNGITTGISEPALLNENGQWTLDNAEWYNLNGQKLNGMPSSSGLYIVNGKKVLVK